VIRLTALAIFVTCAALYVFKDWYKSLCALILLMAVVEHPDMPKTIAGIQGLNPWNLLLGVVVCGWLANRRREQLAWDLPRHISVMLLLYLGVVLVGFMRMISDRSFLDESVLSLTSEHLVNTVKWVIPGVLLYDGCRSRDRFRMALVCIIGVYIALSIQVIRWMPLSSALSGDALSDRAVKILMNEVGYHRVNMSAMLAGASWALFALRPLASSNALRGWMLLGCVMIVFAQALTGGRAGYVTFALVGLVLCLLRWRAYLLLTPVVVVGILAVAPGVTQRMLQGFTPDSRDASSRLEQVLGPRSEKGPDAYTITAGRSVIWPFVIEKIEQRPFTGYGRLAMVRTGLSFFLATYLNEGFAHPHNAYLEMLLDNGLIGFVLVMPFYAFVLVYSFSLFRDSRSQVFVAIGGASSALLLALLLAAMGSQTFYPREGWLGMWCVLFLMLRVRVQRKALLAAAAPQPARYRQARIVPRLTRPPVVAQPALPAARRLPRYYGVPPPMPDIAEEQIWNRPSEVTPLHRYPSGRPVTPARLPRVSAGVR
jgi:O-antigen ligase